MLNDFESRTNGKIKTKVYFGGVMGRAERVARKMRFGLLQMAAFSSDEYSSFKKYIGHQAFIMIGNDESGVYLLISRYLYNKLSVSSRCILREIVNR